MPNLSVAKRRKPSPLEIAQAEKGVPDVLIKWENNLKHATATIDGVDSKRLTQIEALILEVCCQFPCPDGFRRPMEVSEIAAHVQRHMGHFPNKDALAQDILRLRDKLSNRLLLQTIKATVHYPRRYRFKLRHDGNLIVERPGESAGA